MTKKEINISGALTPKQLADRWKIKIETLRTWRHQKKGPSYIKLGGKNSNVIYKLKDILNYESEHTVEPTVS